MRALATALLLVLGACATSSPGGAVASAQVALTVAETSAAAYEKAPGANPAVVAKIKAADNLAYAAVQAAAAGGSVTAAEADIAALAVLVPAMQSPAGAAAVAGVEAAATIGTAIASPAGAHRQLQASP